MYRQYEDPYILQQMLEEALEEYNKLDESDPIEKIVDAHEWIEELRERINFAEYDCDNYDYADEMWMYENVF